LNVLLSEKSQIANNSAATEAGEKNSPDLECLDFLENNIKLLYKT
jgi:hypothetical protein